MSFKDQLKRDAENLYYEKYDGPKADEYCDLKVERDTWWRHWMIEACNFYKQGLNFEEIKDKLENYPGIIKCGIAKEIIETLKKNPEKYCEKFKEFLK
jgi:hypothetical protein